MSRSHGAAAPHAAGTFGRGLTLPSGSSISTRTMRHLHRGWTRPVRTVGRHRGKTARGSVVRRSRARPKQDRDSRLPALPSSPRHLTLRIRIYASR